MGSLGVVLSLLRPAVFLLGWPRVIGRENLRGVRGPLLVISNHIADVDVGFIQTVLPARIRHKLATATGGEALESLRSPAPDRRWLARIYDRAAVGARRRPAEPVSVAAPVRLPQELCLRRRGRGSRLQRAGFPEGKHTEDGKLRPFRAGVGLLANNLRIPILPDAD